MNIRKGFTLIELLVVIAIIAILAAILFPVFAQAKAAAKKAIDLSSIKQIATGTMIYLSDNDDAFPLVQAVDPNTFDYRTGWRWSSVLATGPYIKNTQIFSSPIDPAIKINNPSFNALVPSTRAGSVAPNSFMANAISPTFYSGGYFPPTVTAANHRGLFGASYWYSGINEGSATQTQVEAISETVMYANGAEDWAASVFCTGNDTSNTETTWCNYEDLIAGYYVMNLVTGTNFGSPDPNLKKAWTKFSGGSNYVFADTSAKNLRPGAMLTTGGFLNPRRFLISPPQ